MKESDIQKAVMLAASEAGFTTWRVNTGSGWAGEARRLADGSILIENPRPLRAGLCKGGSDLIGFQRVVITPEMIGQTLARFAGIEVKTPRGRLSGAQARFLRFLCEAGGLGIVARRPEDISA